LSPLHNHPVLFQPCDLPLVEFEHRSFEYYLFLREKITADLLRDVAVHGRIGDIWLCTPLHMRVSSRSKHHLGARARQSW
jgi:hypothetical protein